MNISSNPLYVQTTSNSKSSDTKIFVDPQIEEDRRRQMISDYYEKEVEEDKKFENPYGHIRDKESVNLTV